MGNSFKIFKRVVHRFIGIVLQSIGAANTIWGVVLDQSAAANLDASFNWNEYNNSATNKTDFTLMSNESGVHFWIFRTSQNGVNWNNFASNLS